MDFKSFQYTMLEKPTGVVSKTVKELDGETLSNYFNYGRTKQKSISFKDGNFESINGEKFQRTDVEQKVFIKIYMEKL